VKDYAASKALLIVVPQNAAAKKGGSQGHAQRGKESLYPGVRRRIFGGEGGGGFVMVGREKIRSNL